jgi:thiamine pyrophosphate-dependent acetolactate synthase large subunit-like protein
LTGDIRENLVRSTECLAGFNPDFNWQKQIHTAKKQWNDIITGDIAQNEENSISPTKLMAVLNRVVADDAILTMDQGEPYPPKSRP